jgi:flagellar export protein FliJ
MAFRYKLEALLRLQRSIEHQEENRLLACVARIVSLKDDLQVWNEARLHRRRNALGDLEKGSPGIFLRFAEEWDQAARARVKEILQQLKVAEEARLQQLKIYRAARQKREVLESLRERQQSAYTVEQLRRIQQGLDETHLIRSFYWGNR